MTEADPGSLLPYYVYELRDPRDNEVFYVGKGTGNRIDFHGPGEEKAKEQRIREIHKLGMTEIRVIIGRYETEAEAYAVEAALIGWVYGFNHLTNLEHFPINLRHTRRR